MEPRAQIDRVRIGRSRAHRRGGAGRPQGLGDLIGLPGGRVPVGVGPPLRSGHPRNRARVLRWVGQGSRRWDPEG